jgi:hypothetical protein
MKLAIVGSRTFDNYKLLEKSITGLYNLSQITCIVSGGARGADTLGEIFGKKFHIPLSVHKPQWDTYGKKAGFIRDKEIVDEADEIIAFWDGVSPGTKITIQCANKVNKKVTIVRFDQI